MIKLPNYNSKTNSQILFGLDRARAIADRKMKLSDPKNRTTVTYYIRLKDGTYSCVSFPFAGSKVVSAIVYTANGMVAEATADEYVEFIKKTNAPVNVLTDLACLELAKLILKEDVESFIDFNALPSFCGY